MTNAEYGILTARKQTIDSRLIDLQKVLELTKYVGSLTLPDPQIFTSLVKVIEEQTVEGARINEQLLRKRKYLFNFIGGGWNSLYALTVEEAIAQSLIDYADSSLEVNPTTFRVETPGDYDRLLSSFY